MYDALEIYEIKLLATQKVIRRVPYIVMFVHTLLTVNRKSLKMGNKNDPLPDFNFIQWSAV